MAVIKIAGQRYEPGTPPTADLVAAARRAAGQTQSQAAAEIYYKPRAWQRFEAPESLSSHRDMPPAVFELYCRKVGLWPE